MYRLLPLLFAGAFLAGCVIVLVLVMPSIRRRHLRLDAEAARQAEIDRYQAKAALEDLDRTRERINRQQERYYDERDTPPETPER